MTTSIQIAAVHPRMGSPELPWPVRKSAQAAGYDCHAAIDKPLEMWPGRLVKVPLGFAMALPTGWEAQIRPRSGLASRGLIMPNSPGTVDADYRGEVSALLYYLPTSTKNDFGVEARSHGGTKIHPGDRICQMVIAPVADTIWHTVFRGELSTTARGEGGFGSTGIGAAGRWKSKQHETMSEEKSLSIMAWGDNTILVSIGRGNGDEAEEIKVNIDDAIAALTLIKASKELTRVILAHAPSEGGPFSGPANPS